MSLAASAASAVTVEVRAGETFVISETLAAGRGLHFQFALHPDYVFPVSIKERDKGEDLMRWKDLPYGEYSIPAAEAARTFVISFDNSNTLFTSKNVNFDLRTSLDLQNTVNVDQLDPIERKVRVLATLMQKLSSVQVSMRNQQKDHRATVEDANERVLWWSVFQVIAFLVMSGFQLYLLKRFLEKKTYI